MQFSFTLDPSNFEILIVWTSISLSTVRIISSFISIFGREISRDDNLDLPTVYKRILLNRDKSLWDLRLLQSRIYHIEFERKISKIYFDATARHLEPTYTLHREVVG